MIASITTPTFLGFGFIVVGAFLITAFISDIKVKRGVGAITVITLNFSRMAKEKNFSNIFAAGILVTSGTMFPRMLLYVLVVNYNLFSHLIIPIGSIIKK